MTAEIVIEITSEADRLMVDKYGNYFMQSVCQLFSESQRVDLITSIRHLI